MASVRAFVRRNWKALLTILFLPVFGNIFAGELRDWVYSGFGWKEPAIHLPWTTAVSGALLFATTVTAVFFGRDLFRAHNIALGPNRNPKPHPHIVLFLSFLTVNRAKFTNGVPDQLTLTSDLEHDLTEMARRKEKSLLKPHEEEVRWLWEMPLRGLFHHRNVLQSITLVCSPESIAQVHWFNRLLCTQYKSSFPLLKAERIRLLTQNAPSISFVRCPDSETAVADNPIVRAWDFEDYDELYNGLTAMMRQFEREGIRDKDVIVDVTGGQKPNSVVGALLTVNRRAKFQYVQTNPDSRTSGSIPQYGVIVYDLITDPIGKE